MALEIEQLALVLHSRPYRETSLMLTLLTPEQGKINAVVRGVRTKSKTAAIKQAWCQPFQELRIRWIEKTAQKLPGLVNLSQFEPTSVRFPLVGEASICGLYVNELLYRLLYPQVPIESMFQTYQQTLYDLAIAQNRYEQAWALRQFEYELLMSLGVAFDLTHDAQHQPILENQNYRFFPELGSILEDRTNTSDLSGLGSPISGQCLLQFAQFEPCETCMPQWRRLFRNLLNHYLGGKPIQTRALFQS